MIEVWADVKGYEGNYQISNKGRLKSLEREEDFRGTTRIRGERIRKYSLARGYCLYTLCKDGITKSTSAHRLMAIAFLPNPENKSQVNHKNGIKTDNRLENLEWATRSENQLHRFRDLGHTDKNRKLTKSQVFEILDDKKMFRRDLAKKYGVSKSCIDHIKNGETYRNFSDEWNKLSISNLVK